MRHPFERRGIWLAWLLCLSTPGFAAPADAPLGRLFFTPEWRGVLERQRQLNVQQTQRIAHETVRVDGVVVRSSGKSTVWINQHPQNEHARDSGVVATPSARMPGRVRVMPDGESSVDLKVGVTLNPATQEQSGGLASGEIRVRPESRP